MTEQRSTEFLELRTRAEESLERLNVSLPHHKLLLRLWHYPSFDSYVSWFVYSPLFRYRQSDVPLIHEVGWDLPFDSQRFRDPLQGLKHGFSLEPTLSFRQAEIPSDGLESKLTKLRKIVLPVFIDNGGIGLDGVGSGIETFGSESSFRLVWWCEGYEEWKPIVNWAEEMRQLLCVCLDTRSLTSTAS